MILRKLILSYLNVSINPMAKCILFIYFHFIINTTACCITFLLKPEGHYLQLIYTLRSFSVWGLINACLLLLAVVCGQNAYKNLFKHLLGVVNFLYEICNQLTVIFLIMYFISYLNFPCGLALTYGGLNFYTHVMANSALEELYSKEVKCYTVVDLRQEYVYEFPYTI
eukprot:TRINITY_DN12135_c0_g1_i7.p1 TRINITY_DN12135_c0_g1~~TRINITY_DN12135_c0_g1_i7.p1  ORF type:complete len:168 (-),score=48.94 TRINITY_DN12135_c0_g1_i7:146-649(-)